ncbi:IPT/TIG domain-containing protein [Rufibacter immobilis]|uniref:IPT/TIG domain-containing protein n=1 Tax=Rufibacter immobilis TaxID=1348778 RepID=UPI0035E86377
MFQKINKYLFFLLAVLCLTACEDDDVAGVSTEPALVSINPASGTPSSIVTILGRNFSPVRENNVVKFNGQTAVVLEASQGQLQVVVPENGSSGNVTVTVNSRELQGPTFTYADAPEEFLVSTFAGEGIIGLKDGAPDVAQFRNPEGVLFDAQGNLIVTDRANNALRIVTPAGLVSTLVGFGGTAGNVDGPVATAKLNYPWKSAIDAQGNIYIAERDNHKIRKITPGGVVSTVAGTGTAGFADGPAATAKFNQPLDVAVDQAGNLYVADNLNHRIRKITPDGTVSTIAGNGTASFADGDASVSKVNNPSGVEVDKDGNLLVADRQNHRIRKITPQGVTSTIAGEGTLGSVDGDAAAAKFNQPYGVTVDKDGTMYVADLNNHRIRKITAAGKVSTMAGTTAGYADGPGASARFSQPTDVAVDKDGNVYVADVQNHRVRVIRKL